MFLGPFEYSWKYWNSNKNTIDKGKQMTRDARDGKSAGFDNVITE